MTCECYFCAKEMCIDNEAISMYHPICNRWVCEICFEKFASFFPDKTDFQELLERWEEKRKEAEDEDTACWGETLTCEDCGKVFPEDEAQVYGIGNTNITCCEDCYKTADDKIEKYLDFKENNAELINNFINKLLT